jgi:hypothetical protein
MGKCDQDRSESANKGRKITTLQLGQAVCDVVQSLRRVFACQVLWSLASWSLEPVIMMDLALLCLHVCADIGIAREAGVRAPM